MMIDRIVDKMPLASPEDDGTGRQHAKCQSLLVDFLSADLDVAFTLLNTAATEHNSDSDHHRKLIEKAHKLLMIVRGLVGWVEDRATSSAIRQRADELQSLLSNL